jgi:hypothetical protein
VKGGTYTYTLLSGFLTLAVKDDPCGEREYSLDDVTFRADEAASPSPSTN